MRCPSQPWWTRNMECTPLQPARLRLQFTPSRLTYATEGVANGNYWAWSNLHSSRPQIVTLCCGLLVKCIKCHLYTTKESFHAGSPSTCRIMKRTEREWVTVSAVYCMPLLDCWVVWCPPFFNLGVQVVHRRASSRHENGWIERFLQSMGRDCGRGGHEGPEYEAF